VAEPRPIVAVGFNRRSRSVCFQVAATDSLGVVGVVKSRSGCSALAWSSVHSQSLILRCGFTRALFSNNTGVLIETAVAYEFWPSDHGLKRLSNC
jgi:hypothetical protein